MFKLNNHSFLLSNFQNRTDSWGVKTFSEMLAEKRANRQPKGEAENKDNISIYNKSKVTLGDKSPEHPTQAKPKFTPIRFKEDLKPARPKHKFTPVTFGDEKPVAKTTSTFSLVDFGDASRKDHQSPVSFEETSSRSAKRSVSPVAFTVANKKIKTEPQPNKKFVPISFGNGKYLMFSLDNEKHYF